MLLVTKHRFVAKTMTNSTFSDETVSSQKNRTFRDETEVITIGSFIYQFNETHSFSETHLAYLTPSHRRRFAFCRHRSLSLLSPSPSFTAIQMQSRRFKCNLDASTPKCFQQRFSFCRHRSLSLPSPIHPSRRFRRNCDASSFATLSATFHPSATLPVMHPGLFFFFFFPFELIFFC